MDHPELDLRGYETYNFHIGRVYIEVWYLKRWWQRLKRGLSPISIYL